MVAFLLCDWGVQPSELKYISALMFWLIYNHPRDRKDRTLKVAPPPPLDGREHFFRRLRKRGLEEWQIEARWRKRLASVEGSQRG